MSVLEEVEYIGILLNIFITWAHLGLYSVCQFFKPSMTFILKNAFFLLPRLTVRRLMLEKTFILMEYHVRFKWNVACVKRSLMRVTIC